MINGRASKAQIYPDKLCRAFLSGLMMQMRADNRIRPGETGCCAKTDEDDKGGIDQVFWDDLSGKQLREDLLRSYRSRWVAQEIKMDKREDLFAATPPIEAKKI